MTEQLIHIFNYNFSDHILSEISGIWHQNNLIPVWRTSERDVPFDEIVENLRCSNFNIAALPLPAVPVNLNNDIVIGALSPRENCSYYLAIRNEMYDMTRDLRLKSKAQVYINTDVEYEQLKCLNSSIDIHFSHGDILKKIKQNNSTIDAVLYAKHASFNAHELTGFQHIALHVSEVIPKAGAGVIAFLCHKDDIHTRQLLKSVHQKNTAACTNIERLSMEKVQSFLKFPLSVHIELNHHSHYSAYVFGVLKSGNIIKFNRTQSTSAGLVEYIYTKIESESLNL